MNIKRLQIYDCRFEKFVDKFKNEVAVDDPMHTWLDKKFLNRMDSVLCILHNDCVVGVSCEKVYNNRYLRIGSPQYLCKSFRNIYPNSLFLKNGFFSMHVERAQKENLEIFFSIHAYNKRMQLHAENLYKRRISNKPNDINYLDDVNFLGIHKFHSVEQHIFGYKISNVVEFLKIINCTS